MIYRSAVSKAMNFGNNCVALCLYSDLICLTILIEYSSLLKHLQAHSSCVVMLVTSWQYWCRFFLLNAHPHFTSSRPLFHAVRQALVTCRDNYHRRKRYEIFFFDKAESKSRDRLINSRTEYAWCDRGDERDWKDINNHVIFIADEIYPFGSELTIWFFLTN